MVKVQFPFIYGEMEEIFIATKNRVSMSYLGPLKQMKSIII